MTGTGESMTTRDALRAHGQAMRARLFPLPSDDPTPPNGLTPPGAGAPGYDAMITEAVFGGVWTRAGLGIADRMICTLAALASVQRLRHLRAFAGAALEVGLTPRAIQEICIQIGIYAGMPASEEALDAAGQVFAERGILVGQAMPPPASLEALSAMGEAVMRALHGERAAGGYAAPDNKVTSALYPIAIQWGYGEIWHRPGLERRERALVAVAAFTALKLGQVQKFGESALNVGLSKTEVIEAIVQTGPYSGFAPALNALGALSDVLR